MNINFSQQPQPEIEPDELIGAFFFAFWPVSLIVALLEYLYYDGYGAVPINLAIGSVAGLIGAKTHQAHLRRKNQSV